jgi:hypothetical protein
MPRYNAKVEETLLRLDANLMPEELAPHPTEVRRWGTSNKIQYVLGLLMGWTGKQPKLLRATSAGILKVAPTGVGYEHNEVKAGNAPDAYGAAIAFTAVCSTVDVFIWDFAALISRSPDGLAFDADIELIANSMYSFDAATLSFKVMNKVALSVARYQIIGWR